METKIEIGSWRTDTLERIIFYSGYSKKQPLKIRIKNSIYRYKSKKVEKTIVEK